MELIGGAHERRLERAPTGRIGACADALEVVVDETCPSADDHVLPPLVARAAEPADAQDQDLAIAGGQRRLEEDVIAEDVPAFEELRVAGDRGEDVRHRAATDVGARGLDGRSHFFGPLRFRQWLDPRFAKPHC